MEGTMECSVCYTKDNLKSICKTSPLHQVCGSCFDMMRRTPNCFGQIDLKCPECRGDVEIVREQRQRRCGLCGETGHDRRTCPERDPVAEAERLKKLKKQREDRRARGEISRRVVRGSVADIQRILDAERDAIERQTAQLARRRAETLARRREYQALADQTMARMERANIVAQHTGTLSSRISASGTNVWTPNVSQEQVLRAILATRDSGQVLNDTEVAILHALTE